MSENHDARQAFRIAQADRAQQFKGILCATCCHGMVWRQRSQEAVMEVYCAFIKRVMPLDLVICNQHCTCTFGTPDSVEDFERQAVLIDQREGPGGYQ